MHEFWNDAIFRRPCLQRENCEIHFENFDDPLKLEKIKEGLDVFPCVWQTKSNGGVEMRRSIIFVYN